MIDEASRRKPCFDIASSAPVTLADGQAWHIPKPWLEVRPVFQNGRAVDTRPALTIDAEFDMLKQAVIDAEGEAIILAGANLAADMLRRHYQLDDTELGSLLAFREGAVWIKEIMQVANGFNGPKAGSAGDD
jgi:hypothetical protein